MPGINDGPGELVAIANDFSPRYERHRDDLVVIDVSGLERLLGPPRFIGEELRRATANRSVRVHVALAGTGTAAMVLAHARPGLTVVPRGEEAAALAPIAIEILETLNFKQTFNFTLQTFNFAVQTFNFAFKAWGLRTLGELAALPVVDLVARLGRPALVWQAIARGEDIRPLIPTLPEERFESSLELEWPIEGLEPLSFVLTRLLEPLSTRLERRDRGAAVLHLLLGLVTRASTGSEREVYARRLELPSPMRDVRALRTLALLDLESHPPAAAIDRVTLVIEPTPGRVLQHTLYARPHPTPEQLSTLLARLGALMGQDRIGAATTVDTDRPGAFAMMPFNTEHERDSPEPASSANARDARERGWGPANGGKLVSALRRCRQPVPARVTVAAGRPVRVTTDRRGFAGGQVTACAGPWRTSGEWWHASACGPSERGRASEVSGSREPLRGVGAEQPRGGWGPDATRKCGAHGERRAGGSAGGSSERERASEASGGGAPRAVGKVPHAWDHDEWDVALNDGAVYRIFRDRETDGWFIDAIVD